MLKVIGFDLDGTLTQHRTPLPETSRNLLVFKAALITDSKR